MVTVALFVRLEAKPGKEKEVEQFLRSGLPLVNDEPQLRPGRHPNRRSTFGIFDAFPDEHGRQAHLSGKVAAALMARPVMLSTPSSTEKVDVLAAKLPGT